MEVERGRTWLDVAIYVLTVIPASAERRQLIAWSITRK